MSGPVVARVKQPLDSLPVGRVTGNLGAAVRDVDLALRGVRALMDQVEAAAPMNSTPVTAGQMKPAGQS